MESNVKKIIYNNEQVNGSVEFFIKKLELLNSKYQDEFSYENDIILDFNNYSINYKLKETLSNNIKNEISLLFIECMTKFDIPIISNSSE